MRVLIVDDESLARSVLKSFLQQDADVTCIEECANGSQAIQRLRDTRFDLLFLDVQMPDVDGFGVLNEIPPNESPLVIFVTAFEHHALKAFSVAAVDYLLKPFDDRRFASALARSKQRLRERELTLRSRELVELLGEVVGTPCSSLGKFTVQTDGRTLRVDLSTVLWIEARDKHVVFHTMDDEPIRVRQSLSNVEQMLSPQQFVRVHRSCIVALARVAALEKTAGGVAYVVLDSGARVTVSRSRLPEVRASIQASSS